MHPYVAALGLSALLALAGTGFMIAEAAPGWSAHDEHAPAHPGHAVRAGGHGAGAHPWAGGTGAIPTLTDALTKLERRSVIQIDGDDGFNPANGVRGGSGTFEDPFLISGWYVGTIYIHDTTKAFEIKDSYVSEILILDWTGAGGYVHHVHMENMRTNRNVERVGDPTAAVFEKNEIVRVEELRHFDGIVRNNTIGRADLLGTLLQADVALNIAGLNGAGIHDNRIFGGVDMKIHGHHHSDAEGSHSHNHGQADEAQMEDHVEDHQVRYVDFRFYGNTIKDDGFGLRYNDLNHAGDDRTATSEQEPDLEMPHVHHTRIAIADNVLEGARLSIATVNAQDERHVAGETALLEIHGNRIVKPAAGDGIVVSDVKNARVDIRDNKVEKSSGLSATASAILLQRFSNSTITIGQNALGDYRYGVRARDFDSATNWTVEDNTAPGVDYPVYWDESVANPPAGVSAQEPEHEHDHEADVASVSPLRRFVNVRS